MVKTSLKATEKPTGKPKAPSRHIGSHGHQTAPAGFSESTGDIGVNTTENVACSGSVLVSESVYNHGVDRGRELNGINSGYEVVMGDDGKFKELHKFSDGYLIGGRNVDGQDCEVLLALDPRAQQAIVESGRPYVIATVLLQTLPEGNGSDVVTNLEAQGVYIACV